MLPTLVLYLLVRRYLLRATVVGALQGELTRLARRRGRASTYWTARHHAAPGFPSGESSGLGPSPTATSTEPFAAAAYGPKPSNVESAAMQRQARPSADPQMPPRQLSAPDGPVARNPSGVATTLNTCPVRKRSPVAFTHVRPSTDHQARTGRVVPAGSAAVHPEGNDHVVAGRYVAHLDVGARAGGSTAGGTSGRRERASTSTRPATSRRPRDPSPSRPRRSLTRGAPRRSSRPC